MVYVLTNIGRINIKRRLRERVGNVTPISNPSYGLIADIFETIVMRNFRVNSTAVSITADTLESALKITEKDDIVRLIPIHKERLLQI